METQTSIIIIVVILVCIALLFVLISSSNSSNSSLNEDEDEDEEDEDDDGDEEVDKWKNDIYDIIHPPTEILTSDVHVIPATSILYITPTTDCPFFGRYLIGSRIESYSGTFPVNSESIMWSNHDITIRLTEKANYTDIDNVITITLDTADLYNYASLIGNSTFYCQIDNVDTPSSEGFYNVMGFDLNSDNGKIMTSGTLTLSYAHL